MKSEKLLFNMSNINPKYIEMAEISIKKQSKKASKINKFIRFGLVPACVVLVVVCVFSFGQNWISQQQPSEQNQITTNITDSKTIKFTGFVLTAYAAKEKGQLLTANYLSDTNPTILEPDIKIPLATYSPLMSSVPGLPFTFDVSDGDFEILVAVDKGTLLKWDSNTGIVTDCGQETLCNKSQTLYWSPINNGVFLEKAVIKVIAKNKDMESASQEIIIYSEGGFFSATVGKLNLSL